MSNFNFGVVKAKTYNIEHGFIFADLPNATTNEELENWSVPMLGQGFHVNEIQNDEVINTFDVGLLQYQSNQNIPYKINNRWVVIRGYRYLCIDRDNNLYSFTCIPELNYSIGYKLDDIYKLSKDFEEQLNRERHSDIIAIRNA